MLELARGVSQWAHGLKKGVIFLFNTGEEEGLNGAHSFITQVWNCSLMHPLVVFLFAFQRIEKHESCYLL
jgi:Zn-dependent M28 family amino/carboxypeptidase